MNIHDVENLPASELNERRPEVIEALKDQPAEDLAARYVQARMDANQRDGRLAEQGKTITALQKGLELAEQKTASVEGQLKQTVENANGLARTLVEERTASRAQMAKATQRIEELTHAVESQEARADRNKAEASRNHQAVAQAAKILNDTLATQAVEAANAGD